MTFKEDTFRITGDCDVCTDGVYHTSHDLCSHPLFDKNLEVNWAVSIYLNVVAERAECQAGEVTCSSFS